MMYIPGFSNYLQAAVPRYAAGGEVMEDMAFSDYGLGGPMLGAETVGFDLANPMLGGPEQGGSYTGGMGGGPSRTEEERAAAILDVNPYVAPSADMNLEPITSQRNGDQLGYYFANELGLPARYGDVGSPQPADPTTFDPNAQYEAPMPGFVPVDQNATYRLVNGGTDGSVVYSGAGEEGLRNVFQQANQLTMDNPKNAYWGVEVLDPATGQYKRVAENQGPNGLGIVGDIAGVALPIAAAIATGGASLGVQIAAGAAAGGLGGFLSGNDPLTSALIGGATAGLGNVTGASKAIGSALDNVTGGALGSIGSGAANAAAGDAAGGLASDIVVTGLSKAAAQGIGNAALQGATSGLTNSLSDITGYKTPADKFVQEPVPEAAQPPVDPYAGIDPIVVTGGGSTTGLGGLPGLGNGITASLPALGGLASDPLLSQPTPTEQPTTAEPEEIVVTATPDPVAVIPPELLALPPVVGGLAAATGSAAPNVVNGIDQATGDIVVDAPQTVVPDVPFEAVLPTLPAITPPLSDPAIMQPDVLPDDIVVNAPETVVPEPVLPVTPILPELGIPEVPTPDPALTSSNKLTAKDIADYLRLASLGVSTIGGLLGGDKGGGSTGTIPAGMGALSSLFSKQLPTSTLPSGGALPASTLASQGFKSPQNYYRYGYGPEQSFFDYATQGAPNTSRAYTGYEGTTAEDMFAPQPMRMPQPTLPQPITTPIPNNPAGPIMQERDPMRFAQGGYAVEGMGDGRDDQIPALLSDGEYVIDAETVALLGNGSNKAGAELLDSFRVNVRKQKGKKLARGEFSDNAKRPEHYMAGGHA